MSPLAFLTVLSISGSCAAVDWTKLHLKYDLLLNGYFPIALTLTKLSEDANWKPMIYDETLKLQFYSYGEDPRVAIGFSSNGNIAGVRISFIIQDQTIRSKTNGLNFPYTFVDKPLFTKSTYWDTDVYYTTVLFASPEKIATGVPSNTDGIFAENVFVKINGNYTKMPKKEGDATSLGFTKQGCVFGMGLHYFLGMTSSTKCNDLQQVFLLYQKSELIGIGISPFGSFTSTKRTWFEDPSSFVLEVIVPQRPPCFTKWNNDYGISSIHLFFNEHPRLTTC